MLNLFLDPVLTKDGPDYEVSIFIYLPKWTTFILESYIKVVIFTTMKTK